MSAVGELMLRNMISLRGKLKQSQREELISTEWKPYFQWQYETSAPLFAKYPNWNITGKTVLEIGCGIGGRTAYLASLEPKRVVGIDINSQEIEIARNLCPMLYPNSGKMPEYICTTENDLLKIGQFDIVMLVDCMEHVESPAHMLKLAYSYTKPGGKCYFSNIGWYHHQGSHMGLFPFDNVMFSDETILNVMRWHVSQPDYEPTRYDSCPPIERWCGLYDLRDRPGERLNKITIRETKRLLQYGPFASWNLSIVGFGQRRPLLRLPDVLRHIPILQEVYHSLIVAECSRSSRNVR